jgi:hypothetical protein
MRIRALVPVILSMAAAAQERPQKACSFEGFSAEGKLAEVIRPATGYWGCDSRMSCMPIKLAAGDVVTPYHTDGDWTCAFIQQRDGAGPGWVKAQDLREVHADPAPSLDAWFGTWANALGRIRIAASAAAGKLHLTGENEWHGIGDVVHTGGFKGDASPAGNHLHVVESAPDSCTIDLTLIGRYLVASDNQRCGGQNVRFWGIWKRAAK